MDVLTGKSSINGPFSMAMLNNQMVSANYQLVSQISSIHRITKGRFSTFSEGPKGPTTGMMLDPGWWSSGWLDYSCFIQWVMSQSMNWESRSKYKPGQMKKGRDKTGFEKLLKSEEFLNFAGFHQLCMVFPQSICVSTTN